MSMETKDPNLKASIEAGYEKRDVNVRGILQFGFWMAVVIVITLGTPSFSHIESDLSQVQEALDDLVQPHSDRRIADPKDLLHLFDGDGKAGLDNVHPSRGGGELSFFRERYEM